MATIQAKDASSAPVRILVLGGGYAGLAAGLNLLDLCQGKVARFHQSFEKHVDGKPEFPIKVKFVDERDGYCKLPPFSPFSSTIQHIYTSPILITYLQTM